MGEGDAQATASPAGRTPTTPRQQPDSAKVLVDLKIKLMHMKRNLLGLRQELRNRTQLWDAALDEIETMEGMVKYYN